MKKSYVLSAIFLTFAQTLHAKIDNEFLKKINTRIDKINSLRDGSSNHRLDPGRRVVEQQERYIKKIQNVLPASEVTRIKEGFKKSKQTDHSEVSAAYIEYRKKRPSEQAETTRAKEKLNSLESAFTEFTLQEIKNHHPTVQTKEIIQTKEITRQKSGQTSDQNVPLSESEISNTQSVPPQTAESIEQEKFDLQAIEKPESTLPVWSAQERKAEEGDGLFTKVSKAYKRNTVKLKARPKEESN
jgi:hypothetical protein